MRRNETLAGLAFASPWLVGFLLLVLYPFAATLWWSFCDYDLVSSPRWVGLENYRRIAEELADGGRLGRVLLNTVYYCVVSVSASVVVGVGLATMLSWRVRGQAVYRTLCYLPSVVPVVAATVLWVWLLDPQSGLMNGLLGGVGLPEQGWFQSTSAAALPGSWPADDPGRIFGSKDGLVLMGVWGVGNLLMIYLAAVADVPAHLYEAAVLDGAGRWRRFRHITLPMLTPVIFFNVVMGLIQSVQAFTEIYLVSDGQGDPAGATLTLSLHLFLVAFKELDMGYASALAWVMFVAVVLVTVWLFRTSRYWVHHDA